MYFRHLCLNDSDLLSCRTETDNIILMTKIKGLNGSINTVRMLAKGKAAGVDDIAEEMFQ